MHARFPTISAICRQYGLDLATDLLPVAPAAHYCMGGVLVDTYGRTAVPGLFAVGEVACTGVHGANRLASNSLLEGLVYGLRIADVIGQKRDVWSLAGGDTLQRATTLIPYNSLLREISASGPRDDYTTEQIRQNVQRIMWHAVSLVREGSGLL